jgi:hypothetical protein
MAAQTDKIKISQITNSVRINEMVYDGIAYSKIMPIQQRYKVTTDDGKKECMLWLCVETGAKMPARIVLVPEIK